VEVEVMVGDRDEEEGKRRLEDGQQLRWVAMMLTKAGCKKR
jgi:hypothetical protein